MYGASLMVLVHIIGTLGYLVIGGPSVTWIDCFYMTFITVATIGYGEVVDLSQHPMGRLFTVFIAIVGIGTMSYLFSTLVALLLESDLNDALRKTRMEKQIARFPAPTSCAVLVASGLTWPKSCSRPNARWWS